MEPSNLNEINFQLSNESTDDEIEIPLDNTSKNVVESDQESSRIYDNCNYVFGDKENLSSQSVVNKGSNESGEGSSSSNQIHCVDQMNSQVLDKTSNMSKANLSDNNSTVNKDELFLENHPKNESVAGKTEHRRSSIVFSLKKKSSFHGIKKGQLDDSGIGMNNSVEMSSPRKTESVMAGTKSIALKTYRSRSTSEESEVSLDNNSRKDSVPVDSQQINKIEHRQKKLAPKRKFSYQGTQVQDSIESHEKPTKRGRGIYKLRDLSRSSRSDNVNEKNLAKKDRLNKSKKGSTSIVNNEDETEDSEEDVEMKQKGETKKIMTENKVESLSRRQAAHNAKVLQILNERSPAKLRTLSRIGPKTSMMIHQFRKLNGKLKSIRDLENMSGWTPRFLEQFMSSNNLTFD